MPRFLAALVLGLVVSSANADFPLEYDRAVSEPTRIQLESDLENYFSMRGANPSPLFREIFGSFDRRASARWFFSRVRFVGENLCMDESAVACVLSAWDNWIFLSPNYTRYDHPRVARLMVLFHEARHTERENRFWPHARCPKNFTDEKGRPVRSIWTGAELAGESACDLETFGSYGVSAILLLNIAYRCDNCSAEDRREAEIYGLDQLRRITWKPARERIVNDLELSRSLLGR